MRSSHSRKEEEKERGAATETFVDPHVFFSFCRRQTLEI